LKKSLLYFLAAFVLPILGILWWWGLFSSAQVEIAERGPYRYAYLDAEGSYSKLAAKRGEVELALRQQNLMVNGSISILYDDPRTSPEDKRRARTGFLIDDHVSINPPLAVDSVPRRKVLVARIKAHPAIAYGKAYGALLDYTQQHKIAFRMPALELYGGSELIVEMPLESSQ
jgi:effector-binding domain-containing protein